MGVWWLSHRLFAHLAQAWQVPVNLDETSLRKNRPVCLVPGSLSDQAQFEQSSYRICSEDPGQRCSPTGHAEKHD